MDAEALIGKVLGTCTLQELVGRGGMGAVFLAQQSRPRRQVAVKVLLPMTTLQPYQKAAFLERFRRETDALASLVHPNIVPVHEYGEQDGLAYLVMPYVSGGTLRDQLERDGKLPLTQAVSYLEQMGAALHFAHERGIIHRDIKPANILLTPEKRLVLTDFGLVKIITDESRGQEQLSGPGMPMGTPDYMSPEQGLGQEIDARADLYSLGIILYQMVTGVVPFKGEMPMKVVMQHLDTPPPLPRALRPDLPSSAERVILQALAKKPEDRYSHTLDFASAFRQALEAAGVVLPDASGNTASIRIVKSDGNMSNRQRSLFDPVWRGDQSQQAQDQPQSLKQEDERLDTNMMENQPENELLEQQGGDTSLPYMPSTRLRSRRKANLSAQYPQTDHKDKENLMPSPESADVVGDSKLKPTGRTGLLRSFAANSPLNGQAQEDPLSPIAAPRTPNISNNTRQLDPPTPPDNMQSWSTGPASIGINGTFNTVQENLDQSEATGSFNVYNSVPPGATGVLRTQTGALIPVNLPGATGTFMVPSGNGSTGQTGMLKLTQPVKVVKVPLAGQPGQYVTGLLPVVSSTKEGHGWPEQQEDTSLKGRIQRNMKVLILIAAVVVLVFGSVIFLLTRPSAPIPGITQTVPNNQPNKIATSATYATATAQANLIVADSLTGPTHGWPNTQNGTGNDRGNYVFENGEYHITATSDKTVAAVALLPDITVSNQFVYKIALNEVNGLDDSTDAKKVNTFGVIFRFFQQDDQHLSYYAFLINPNKAKPSYEFQKYDSFHDGDPHTQLWTGTIGNEYNLNHKVNNTLKISVDGTHFTFNVNGKDVVSKDDNALASGQIGMIVNLKDTEVAFSNLLLTYH